jgi:hypothetical protein
MKINLKELKREYKAEHDYLKEYFEFNIQKIEKRAPILKNLFQHFHQMTIFLFNKLNFLNMLGLILEGPLL